MENIQNRINELYLLEDEDNDTNETAEELYNLLIKYPQFRRDSYNCSNISEWNSAD